MRECVCCCQKFKINLENSLFITCYSYFLHFWLLFVSMGISAKDKWPSKLPVVNVPHSLQTYFLVYLWCIILIIPQLQTFSCIKPEMFAFHCNHASHFQLHFFIKIIWLNCWLIYNLSDHLVIFFPKAHSCGNLVVFPDLRNIFREFNIIY